MLVASLLCFSILFVKRSSSPVYIFSMCNRWDMDVNRVKAPSTKKEKKAMMKEQKTVIEGDEKADAAPSNMCRH